MATITSANSVFTLNIPALFPVPQILQGFATDDAFAADGLDLSESIMGVDGRMSSGYTPNITKMVIALQADSPSLFVFEYWFGQYQTNREVSFAQGNIILSGPGKSYTLRNGVLNNVKQLPDAKKTLAAQQFTVMWEKVTIANV